MQTNEPGALAAAKSRVSDWISLSKPELTLLSVLTAVCGAYLASGTDLYSAKILHTFLGTLLVGSGAGILNQFIERDYDRLMRRTSHRPLPSGRVRPFDALILGVVISLAGVADLTFSANPLAGSLAIATLATYLFLYTPLKRLTPLATAVGAIPGALPPLIGWVAVRGEFSAEGVALFAVLYFWQMPHFLSHAWMYRLDYARAGFRILAVVDPEGKKTSGHILGHSLALGVVSLVPFAFGFLGLAYALSALLLGSYLIICAVKLHRTRSTAGARQVFLASLVYLPGLLLGTVLGKF